MSSLAGCGPQWELVGDIGADGQRSANNNTARQQWLVGGTFVAIAMMIVARPLFYWRVSRHKTCSRAINSLL